MLKPDRGLVPVAEPKSKITFASRHKRIVIEFAKSNLWWEFVANKFSKHLFNLRDRHSERRREVQKVIL